MWELFSLKVTLYCNQLGKSFKTDADGNPLIDFRTDHSSTRRYSAQRINKHWRKDHGCICSFFLLAAAWGIVIAVFFHPGQGISLIESHETIQVQEISLQETLINFVPKNIFESLAQGTIIQLIVFALFFGLALNHYLQKHPESQLLQLVIDFNEVIITVINYVMRLAPIGIFALVTSSISQLGIQVIVPLLKYLLVYSVGTILFLGFWLLIITLFAI